MSWVKRAGGGSSRGIPDTSDQVVVHQGPAFTSPGQVTRAPYRQEPYVRVCLPEGTQDAKATAWSSTHVLISWPGEQLRPCQAWVPAGWVSRIGRDESSWADPYDQMDAYYPV